MAASRQPDAPSRVRHLLAATLDLYRRAREPGASELAVLSDMRALEPAARAPLAAMYAETFAIMRNFFAPPGGDGPGKGTGGSRSAIAATHLSASLQWLPAWIDQYQLRDFPRVEARLFDVLSNGLGRADVDWPMSATRLCENDDDSAQSRFLGAATRLINSHGYAGASVERIAAELGVSTGSFYHHLDNKDDLVLACFHRSFATIEAAQAHGDSTGRNEGERLGVAAALLVGLQFGDDSPLLRMSAYQALPLDLRAEMLELAGQVTRHVAGTIMDGVTDGSLRAVDPLIASETVMAAISAASDLRRWAKPRPMAEAIRAYLQPLRSGIFG